MSEEEDLLYVPFGTDEFGASEIFAQAASALDIAAVFAIDRKDTDALIKVADSWTKLGSAISEVQSSENTEKSISKFGFRSLDEEEEDADRCKSEDKGKHENRGVRLRKH